MSRTLAPALALSLLVACSSPEAESTSGLLRREAGTDAPAQGDAGHAPTVDAAPGATVDAAPACRPPDAASDECKACLCARCPEAATGCDATCWRMNECVVRECGVPALIPNCSRDCRDGRQLYDSYGRPDPLVHAIDAIDGCANVYCAMPCWGLAIDAGCLTPRDTDYCPGE